jgi:S1-C subfamily serine protease
VPGSTSISFGSGVIVDADGYIVTNTHVIEGGTEVAVMLADGSARLARVVGADLDSDVALLKVDGGGLAPIAMADIGEVAVGDVVLAVGNPLAVGQTVSQGIVGGMRAVTTRDRVIDNIIQTDAAINPGSSGGALVDVSGRLIGINCVILSMSGGSEGIAFAIPVDVVRKMIATLRRSGTAPRAWLGLFMDRGSRDDGARVIAVEDGAPSQRAGLKPGDVLVDIGDRRIHEADDVAYALQQLVPGTRVGVCVRRDAGRACADVELGTLPPIRAGFKVLAPRWNPREAAK